MVRSEWVDMSIGTPIATCRGDCFIGARSAGTGWQEHGGCGAVRGTAAVKRPRPELGQTAFKPTDGHLEERDTDSPQHPEPQENHHGRPFPPYEVR